MYCRNCGSNISEDARFCKKCGLEISKEAKVLPEMVEPSVDTKNEVPKRKSGLKIALTIGIATICVCLALGLVLLLINKGSKSENAEGYTSTKKELEVASEEVNEPENDEEAGEQELDGNGEGNKLTDELVPQEKKKVKLQKSTYKITRDTGYEATILYENEYDTNGILIKHKVCWSNGDVQSSTEVETDANGNIIRRTDYSHTTGTSITEFEYNEMNKCIAEVMYDDDGEKNRNEYEYGDDYEVKYEYDSDNNLTHILETNYVNDEESVIRLYKVDELGQKYLVYEINKRLNWEKTSYYEMGECTSIFESTYDKDGKKVETSVQNSEKKYTINYIWDEEKRENVGIYHGTDVQSGGGIVYEVERYNENGDIIYNSIYPHIPELDEIDEYINEYEYY